MNKQKEFGNFKSKIPEFIALLCEKMSLKGPSFSYEEIDMVQNFYQRSYKNTEKIDLTTQQLDECFYAYFGEAFIHYNLGEWELCTTKNDEAFGTPIILNWGKDNFPHSSISPYIWKEYIIRGLMDEPISEIIKRAQIPMNP